MPTTRRRRLGLGLAATALALGIAAAPAGHAVPPPDRIPVPFVFVDTDIDKVWFVNTTRAAYCDGASFEPAPVGSARLTPKGAVAGRAVGHHLPIEVWPLVVDTPSGPCEDTEDTERWADGTTFFTDRISDAQDPPVVPLVHRFVGRAVVTDHAGTEWVLAWRGGENERCAATGAPGCGVGAATLTERR